SCRMHLNKAAIRWMENNRFFDDAGAGLFRQNVYFEQTLEQKIARIAQIEPAVHVDDLINVFNEPTFPASVRGILYGPNAAVIDGLTDLVHCPDWLSVEKEIVR